MNANFESMTMIISAIKTEFQAFIFNWTINTSTNIDSIAPTRNTLSTNQLTTCFNGTINRIQYTNFILNFRILRVTLDGATIVDITDTAYYKIGSTSYQGFTALFKELASEFNSQQLDGKAVFSQSIEVLQKVGPTFFTQMYLEFNIQMNEHHSMNKSIQEQQYIEEIKEILKEDIIEELMEDISPYGQNNTSIVPADNRGVFGYIRDLIDQIRMALNLMSSDGLGYNLWYPQTDQNKSSTELVLRDGYQLANYILPFDLIPQAAEFGLRRTSDVFNLLETGQMFYPETIPNLIGDSVFLLQLGSALSMFYGRTLGRMLLNNLAFNTLYGGYSSMLVDPAKSMSKALVSTAYETAVQPVRQYNNTNMFFDYLTKKTTDNSIELLSTALAHGSLYGIQRVAMTRLPARLQWAQAALKVLNYLTVSSLVRQGVPATVRYLQQPYDVNPLEVIEHGLKQTKNVLWMENLKQPEPTQTVKLFVRGAKRILEGDPTMIFENGQKEAAIQYLRSAIKQVNDNSNYVMNVYHNDPNFQNLNPADQLKIREYLGELSVTEDILLHSINRLRNGKDLNIQTLDKMLSSDIERNDIYNKLINSPTISSSFMPSAELSNYYEDFLGTHNSLLQNSVDDDYSQIQFNIEDPLSFNPLQNNKLLLSVGALLLASLGSYYSYDYFKKRDQKYNDKNTLQYYQISNNTTQNNTLPVVLNNSQSAFNDTAQNQWTSYGTINPGLQLQSNDETIQQNNDQVEQSSMFNNILTGLLGAGVIGGGLYGGKKLIDYILQDRNEKIVDYIEQNLPETSSINREFPQQNTLLLSRKLRKDLQNFRRKNIARLYQKIEEEENDQWYQKRRRRDFPVIYDKSSLKRRRM